MNPPKIIIAKGTKMWVVFKVDPPSWCCQKCGENIGWLGRFVFPFLHKCKGDTK
jgi:hypothetical protein